MRLFGSILFSLILSFTSRQTLNTLIRIRS